MTSLKSKRSLAGSSESFKPLRVSWEKPTGDHVKLNVDGGVNNQLGRVGIGCVVRDARGHWLIGEARRLGWVKPLTAELCAIYFGLRLVRQNNFSSDVLESDSLEAVNLILGSDKCSIEDKPIIQSCKDLLSQAWKVEIKHVFREANKVPDWLAKWIMKHDMLVSELVQPPVNLLQVLDEDASGTVSE